MVIDRWNIKLYHPSRYQKVIKKKEKKIKNLISKQTINQTSNIMSTKIAENKSNKLKSEIRQILYLWYQHNKIAKRVYNNLTKSL